MKTVLVIEDNINIRENIFELLEMEAYNVILTPNCKLGIASAKENLPDLILCDIRMPDGDGYEVLNILKNDPKTSRIPFIFLTSSDKKKDTENTQGIIADGFIRKPFDAKELFDTIERCLKKE